MSQNDSRARMDGYQAISTGVDSGRSPNTLDRNQLSWMVNLTTRDGFPTCRPGRIPRPLEFDSPETKTAFEDGLFQGAWPYLSDAGTVFHIVSIGGHIFLVDLQSWLVQDLSALHNLYNFAAAPRAWFVQAENYLIIQNATDAALIYDGSNLRRSAAGGTTNVDEVPAGSVMEYNNGRLWVAAPDGYRFVAGDLVYSVTGQRADVLGFTENTFLNGGGFFVVPAQAGPIVAMRSLAVQDTPLGQGPLQVITTRGAFNVNAPFDREEWQNTKSPIVAISMLAAGATAQASTIPVNGDLWFRSFDGIRSFAFAQRDHGTWANTPVSREVSRALDYDTATLLEYSSAALYDNRLTLTTQPYKIEGHGVAHRGLVVLDFAPVSRMFNRSAPAWEGVWTGLNILQVLVTDGIPSRSWIYILDGANQIKLWEQTKGERFDADRTRIEWALETPAYGFDTGGWSLREFAYADFWINRITGEVNLTFTYRCDHDQVWQPWSTASFCASFETCNKGECEVPASYLEQYRPRVRLPTPSGACDSLTGKPRHLGYRFAIRVEGRGFAALPQLRLIARDLPELVDGACPPATCVMEASTGCAPNDYTYNATA